MGPLDTFREMRPWGWFNQYTANQVTTVKILTVLKGEALSLQTHEHRDEMWIVLDGVGWAEVDGRHIPLSEFEQKVWVGRGEPHRLVASDVDALVVLEIAFGDFDERDIVRLDDKYGRVDNGQAGA